MIGAFSESKKYRSQARPKVFQSDDHPQETRKTKQLPDTYIETKETKNNYKTNTCRHWKKSEVLFFWWGDKKASSKMFIAEK